MKICIVGTGYVGLVTGACLAHTGHQVICVDKEAEKIKKLSEGAIPFFEPGLEEIVEENVTAGRLKFSTEIDEGIINSEIIYIATGTPEGKDGQADLSSVVEVAEIIGDCLNDYKIIVIKSTVPVGTGEYVKNIIESRLSHPVEFAVVSNPEFLRQGSAVADTFQMSRAVIGSSDLKAAQTVASLNKTFTSNILITDHATAEMTKYAANAFLAAKITFINQIANICEKVGADVAQVAQGMGLDPRIGPAFLQAGVGFGGSCFPKDCKALLKTAETIGYDFSILREVIKANELQSLKIVEKTERALGGLTGKTIAVLGLTFKPNTDDLRNAPSLTVIEALFKKNVLVKAYDPLLKSLKLDKYPPVTFLSDLYETLKDCEGAIILTEWQEIKNMDFTKVKNLMKGKTLVDGRNIFSPQEVRKQGFNYYSIGRP